MERAFFYEFPAVWDAFEKQLRKKILEWLAVMLASEDGKKVGKLSGVYEDLGFTYWRLGAGAGWVKRLEEVFFDISYFDTIRSIYHYPELDKAMGKAEKLGLRDPDEIYRAVVKPLLDAHKQELVLTFEIMKEELDAPQPYVLKFPGNDRKMKLGFQSRCLKRSWKGMEGYTYTFNGRVYKDIQSFISPAVEELAENISIGKDAYGEMVLRRYTQIPTFDSGDREWDSEENEYLMCDGRDIHLIVMRGGYRIAHLKFYEKLLTADIRMKPVFEKLGWPVDGIQWT